MGGHTALLPQKIFAALTAAKRLARSFDEVRGVDFGFAYEKEKMTRRRSVRFHMNRKRRLGDLPRGQRLPDTILGLEVDVLGIGYSPHDDSPRAPHDPLQPGISIGNRKQRTTGTLGVIVRARSGQEHYLLSNWHVLCGGPEAAPNDEITQPGPMDSGDARTVARLERWLRLGEQFDAALARLEADVHFNDQLFATQFRPAGTKSPSLGMRLVKSGAVSGVTRAVVDGIGGTYLMDYTAYGDSPQWMQGFRLVPDAQNLSNALSLPGDSGSLWIDSADGRAVGLHFAGEDDASPLNDYALAHPIGDLLTQLNVELPPTDLPLQ
jgi:hypothetical protein